MGHERRHSVRRSEDDDVCVVESTFTSGNAHLDWGAEK